MTSPNFDDMFKGLKNAAEELAFHNGVEVDVFCEQHGIIQTQDTARIVALVVGLDGIEFFKNRYPLFVETGVGLVKTIQNFITTVDYADENVSNTIDELEADEDEDEEYHGAIVSQRFFDSCIAFNEIREFLKDTYNITNPKVEWFIYNTAMLIATLFGVRSNDTEPCGWELVETYAELVDVLFRN
jgi:hypothetical protein